MKTSVTAGDGQPCSRCGQRIAAHRWSYVYGRARRGANPRTGEYDHRPLGTDTVFLCRHCERLVLRARLSELARRNPYEAILALLGLVGFIWGTRYITIEAAVAAWAVIGIGIFWLGFNWAIRRPKAMCKGVFLLRRKELAALHGLKPKEVEPYLDVAV